MAFMKEGLYVRHLFIGLLLALAAAVPAWAQDVSAVELQIERLRSQLRDVIDREAQLQDRASQLEDDLRPENIERSVAAIGTTDAAALRASRREQIEKQKAEVDTQLSEAAAQRARLEGEVAAAEAEAVRLKAAALGPGNNAPRPAPGAAPAAAAPATAPAVKKKTPVRKRTPRRRHRPGRRL